MPKATTYEIAPPWERIATALERIAAALEARPVAPVLAQAPPPGPGPVFVGAPQVVRCKDCNAMIVPNGTTVHSPNCPHNPVRGGRG